VEVGKSIPVGDCGMNPGVIHHGRCGFYNRGVFLDWRRGNGRLACERDKQRQGEI
jgi:hypothetical protein